MWRVAFTALAVLVRVASELTLPAPGNLSVTCKNFQVSANWSYSDEEPGTEFVVKAIAWIEGSPVETEYRTAHREFDLSSEVRGSLARLLLLHQVNVSAKRGSNHSKQISLTFSFDSNLSVHKCHLDFPLVNVTRDENNSAIITFQNPLEFYEELKAATDAESAELEYYVKIDQKTYRLWKCEKGVMVCKATIKRSGNFCVTLINGTLFKNRNNPKNPITFKDSEQVCVKEVEEDYLAVTLVVLIVVLVVIVTVLGLVIWKVKAWTLKPAQLPKVITTKFDVVSSKWSHQNHYYDPALTAPPSPEVLTVIEGQVDDREQTKHLFEEEHEAENASGSLVVTGQVDLGDGDQVTVYNTRSELQTALNDDSSGSLKTQWDYMKREETSYDRPHGLMEPQVNVDDTEQTSRVTYPPGWSHQDQTCDSSRTSPKDILIVLDEPEHLFNKNPQVIDDLADESLNMEVEECHEEEVGESSPYDRAH